MEKVLQFNKITLHVLMKGCFVCFTKEKRWLKISSLCQLPLGESKKY